MKRLPCIFLLVILTLLFSACGNKQPRQTAPADKPPQSATDSQPEENNTSESAESGKILIAYFRGLKAEQDNLELRPLPAFPHRAM